MSSFKMNPNFERDVKRDIEKVMQAAADQVHRQHAGQPLAVTKPATKRAFERAGINLSDQELTRYAQQIADGIKIKFAVS